jgi:hypothetical protein
MKPLLAFYYGSHPDHRGRYLAEIVRQDDIWLEVTHDFIQWLFPLREFSRVTPFAPVIEAAIVDAFHQDELLREHMHAALNRMLRFYGLHREGNAIVKAPNWNERKANWFVEPTHNDLRITRILKSLATLGLAEEARRFLAALEALRSSEPDCGFTPVALRFWREAVPGSS